MLTSTHKDRLTLAAGNISTRLKVFRLHGQSSKTTLRRARNLSTTAPSLYNASHSLSADVRPEAIKKPYPNVQSRVSGLAQKLREKAPLMTEPYIAYGATRDLIKECARPGEYKIPQALQKGAEIPTIENGVHLGEGEGWWYESGCPKRLPHCCNRSTMSC